MSSHMLSFQSLVFGLAWRAFLIWRGAVFFVFSFLWSGFSIRFAMLMFAVMMLLTHLLHLLEEFLLALMHLIYLLCGEE